MLVVLIIMDKVIMAVTHIKWSKNYNIWVYYEVISNGNTPMKYKYIKLYSSTVLWLVSVCLCNQIQQAVGLSEQNQGKQQAILYQHLYARLSFSEG